MSLSNNITLYSISDLEKILSELTRLQKENISLLLELEETKHKVLEAKAIAEINTKVYAGIKKYFK